VGFALHLATHDGVVLNLESFSTWNSSLLVVYLPIVMDVEGRKSLVHEFSEKLL
jgi:hypothetical protein